MSQIGYTRSPKLLKGALVGLAEDIIGITPNIIPFQYNPTQVRRSLTPWNPTQVSETERGQLAPDAQPFDPKEKIDITVELDASDQLEDSDPVATVIGIADRIAAIEKLLLPTQGLIGDLLSSAAALVGAPTAPVKKTVPIVLFVWGPGRIVPVRITNYSIEEQLYLPTLYPMRASVTLSLEVLTPDVFQCQSGIAVSLAIAAYRVFRLQQNLLAVESAARGLASSAAVSLSLSFSF